LVVRLSKEIVVMMYVTKNSSIKTILVVHFQNKLMFRMCVCACRISVNDETCVDELLSLNRKP